MVMPSCSSDEDVKVNNGDAISFNVTAGKASRHAATTTNSISEFKVRAFTSDGVLMNDYSVTRTKTGDTWSAWSYAGQPNVFWPTQPVDFFSISPINHAGTFAQVGETHVMALNNYVVSNGKEDLLYSYKKGATKPAKGTSDVTINFRHALSQIVFKAYNSDEEAIKVAIKGIRIANLYSTSSLTWATESTEANMTTTNNDTQTDATWGTWGDRSVFKSYTFMKDNVKVDVPAGATALAATQFGEPLFLMPQTITAWDKKTLVEAAETNNGSAILIDCVVKNKAGVQIWPRLVAGEGPQPETAELAIPLSGEALNAAGEVPAGAEKLSIWKQGKKYTYILQFGEGAGYNPGDDDDPVLVKISFQVTVDELQDGGDWNVNMGK